MSRSQYWLLIGVAFIGGMMGGFLSTRLLPENGFVFAQGATNQIKQKQIIAKTIIAEEFFLHGKKEGTPLDGNILIPRALLTTEPDGNPKWIMQDSNGNPRFSIQLEDENGTTLAFLNEEGGRRLLLSEKNSDGNSPTGSTLALMDNNGMIRAQMGVQEDNNPFLSLNDPPSAQKGEGRNIKFSLLEKDKARISMCGVDGSRRAKLEIDSAKTCLSLLDPGGKTRAEFGNTELAFGQDGSLKKHSSDGFSVEKRPVSSLVLYNDEGKVSWSAP